MNKEELAKVEEVIDAPPIEVGDKIEPLVPKFPEIPNSTNKGE